MLSIGGLVAVGLGNGSSYVALGLAAGIVYTGLNALTTAHRAIVADDVEDSGRPAATSAQEIAGLVGAVIAISIGGALIEPAPAAAFALAAGVIAATAVPTAIVTRRLRLGERAPEAKREKQTAGLRELARRPGAREVLVAQVMWVFGYAALPAFFVLYAEHSLGLGVAAAGALPLGFGVLTALGMILAARAPAERVHGLLVGGAVLLGAGLLAAAPATSLPAAAPAFAIAAVGAGIVTALGFPYFARFVPDGQAGRYSGVFFAGRAVAAAGAAACRARGRAERQLSSGALVRHRGFRGRAAARGRTTPSPRSRALGGAGTASTARDRRRGDPRLRLRARGRGGQEHARLRRRARARGRRRPGAHLTLTRRAR